jgi:hypothetical protein
MTGIVACGAGRSGALPPNPRHISEKMKEGWS